MRFSPGKHFLIISIIAMSVILGADICAAKGFSVKTLRSGSPGADYIAIAPKMFHDELAPLLEQRAADGMRVVLVEPEDIYAEFDRWPVGPKAIRAFVRFAYANWQAPTPQFVLLCGDVNVLEDYDPDGPMVPTFMAALKELLEDGDDDDVYYTAADAPYADMDGDEIPDISVGRIPVDTPEELKAIVGKIINYENNPVPGPWRRRVSAFASTGDFGLFDSTLEELTKRITRNNFNPAFDMNMTYAGSKLPYFALPDDFDSKVMQRFNEGALFMQYIGHGSGTGLSRVCFRGKCRDILEIDDIPEINTGGRSPFFFSICCLTGKFNMQTDSIAEELLKNPTGPVGVFAAGEISGPYPNAVLSKDILYFLVQRRPKTIGEGVKNLHRGLVRRFDDDRKFLDKQYTLVESKEGIVKQTYDHIYLYNYMGDPATKIQYPADNLVITAPAKAAAGDTFKASFKAAEASAGKLLVTLEINLTEALYDVRSIQDLSGDALEAQVKKNYENANNKVAFEAETQLGADGTAEVEITVPKTVPAGVYYVKGYAWDGIPDAMGMSEIKIDSPVLPIVMEEPEEEQKETVLNVLSDVIGKVKDPDISEMKTGKTGGGKLTKSESNAPEGKKKSQGRRRAKRPEVFDREDSIIKAYPKAKLEMLEQRFKADPLDAPGAVALAAAYLDAGKPDQVISMLKRAELLGPDVNLNIDIAAIYSGLYQYEDAAAALHRSIDAKAADDKKENAEKFETVCAAYSELVKTLLESGRTKEAEQAAKDRAEYAGNDLASLKGLIYLYREMSGLSDLKKTYRYTPPAHLPELVAAYDEAEKLATSDDSIHGEIFFLRASWVRDLAAAENKARSIIRSAALPDWREYIPRLAQVLLARDDANAREAFEWMWKYYKLEGKEFPKAMAVASFVRLLNLGGSPMADNYVDMALKISPGCAECNLPEWESHKSSQQVKLCGRALEINPELGAAHRCLADAYFKKEEFEKASDYFESARRLGREDLSRDEVLAAHKAGRERRALDLLGIARQFEKKYSDDRQLNIAVNRMMLLAELEEYGMAEDVYLAYIKENPEVSEIHHYMARVYARREEWNLSILHEKYAVTSDPYCRECLAGLGEFSAKAGQWRDAENAYRAALSLSPRSASVRAGLSEALLNNGDRDEARKMLYQAISMDRNNLKAQEVLLKFINPSYFFD